MYLLLLADATFELDPSSRLACQIRISAALDGIKLQMPAQPASKHQPAQSAFHGRNQRAVPNRRRRQPMKRASSRTELNAGWRSISSTSVSSPSSTATSSEAIQASAWSSAPSAAARASGIGCRMPARVTARRSSLASTRCAARRIVRCRASGIASTPEKRSSISACAVRTAEASASGACSASVRYPSAAARASAAAAASIDARESALSA